MPQLLQRHRRHQTHATRDVQPLILITHPYANEPHHGEAKQRRDDDRHDHHILGMLRLTHRLHSRTSGNRTLKIAISLRQRLKSHDRNPVAYEAD
jgi:hypothetical protein